MFTEPLAGWREVAVRVTKTKVDWAVEMARILKGSRDANGRSSRSVDPLMNDRHFQAGELAVPCPIPDGAVERVAERFAQPVLADREESVATTEIGVDHRRVPLGSSAVSQYLINAFRRQRAAIGPRGVHRVEAVCNRQDACQQGDRIAREPFRIAAAVVAFVVVEHTGKQVGDRLEASQDVMADDRVCWMCLNSSSVSGPRLVRMSSRMPILPISWRRPAR